jgi:hypothetical protein
MEPPGIPGRFNMFARELTQVYEVHLCITNYAAIISNGAGYEASAPIEDLSDLLVEHRTKLNESDALLVVDRIVKRVIGKIRDAEGQNVEPLELIADPARPLERYWTMVKSSRLDDSGSAPLRGVVVNRTSETLRTGGVVFEAMLSESKAVDAYSAQMREEVLRSEQLKNARESLVQLLASSGSTSQVETAAKLLRASAEDVLDRLTGTLVSRT